MGQKKLSLEIQIVKLPKAKAKFSHCSIADTHS